MNKRIMTLVAGLAWAARSVIAPYRNGQDARCPSCGRGGPPPRQARPLLQRVATSVASMCWPVVQNAVPSRMNSGRFACMMPLRCWMGSLRVRMYFG